MSDSDKICSCIQQAENFLISSSGQMLTEEEKSIAKLWCDARIAPKFIAEYLKNGSQWFVVAAVSTRIGRKLNQFEIDLAITLYEKKWEVDDIVEEIEPQADEYTDSPAG